MVENIVEHGKNNELLIIPWIEGEGNRNHEI